MPKSLAEMRQSPIVGLPERTVEICLAQPLMAKVQRLTEEIESLRLLDAIAPSDEEGHSDEKPRRLGAGVNPRIAEAEAEREATWEEMREHTGLLRLRGVTSGDWRRWAISNPARDAETHGGKVDIAVAKGWCNADAVASDLGRYAVAWNDEPLAEGDWEFIANRAAPGDLKKAVAEVVEMHEGEGMRAPKASPTRSSSNPSSGTDLSSPADSESLSDAS